MSNEIFTHKFFGWLEAEARRHINPDGSEGAIVAVTARIAKGLILSALIEIGPYAKIGPDAYIGPRAKIGSDAYIGPYAKIGPGAYIEKGDWFMSIGPIGSEGRHTTIVHKCGVGLRFWTGCFQDKTVAEFRAAIAETHGDNEHAAAYLWMLDAVERHPEVLKREAGDD
jgi:NDP-sugar pyrophosphorylase family protein